MSANSEETPASSTSAKSASADCTLANPTPANPTLAELGEHAVIEHIRAAAPSSRNGDDAAVIAMTTPNARFVASTDMLVENRHFTFDWSEPEHIGAKAAIQNFADIEAMGARPTALLFGIAAPPETPVEIIAGIARGLWEQGSQCPAELVGGDVARADAVMLSITAMGELGGPVPPLRRSGARPGDIVIASGTIGYSAAGLALLEHYGAPGQVPERFTPLVQRHLVPEFEYGRGAIARAAGASSLTDISDGLAIDAAEIAAASGVVIDLDPEAIAADELLLEAAEHLGVDAKVWVLNGGEDHVLLGTTNGQPPTGFRKLGRVTKSAAHPGEYSATAALKAGCITIAGTPVATSSAWVAF